MCRLLGYLGAPLQLDKLLYKPPHSLVAQAYQPREMGRAILNADGFGVGWYRGDRPEPPYIYKNILPIWNDINLVQLSRYIESGCIVGYVRSATPGLAVDLSNCQPFSSTGLSGVRSSILFTHNGFIERFRDTLYRPLRNRLDDELYRHIQGTTDSEHIFALILHHLQASEISLEDALGSTLQELTRLAQELEVEFYANIVISDGKQLVASRYGNRSPALTLYWLRDDPNFPDAVIVASEPLFAGNWMSCPQQSVICVGENLEVHVRHLD